MPVYYINLDSRRERRGLMEWMLAEQPHTRVRATNTDEVREMLNKGTLICRATLLDAFPNRTFWVETRRSTFTYTEAATTYSHLSAIRQAYDTGAPTALILEDDLELVQSRREVCPGPARRVAGLPGGHGCVWGARSRAVLNNSFFFFG